jgi:hypothetical protein
MGKPDGAICGGRAVGAGVFVGAAVGEGDWVTIGVGVAEGVAVAVSDDVTDGVGEVPSPPQAEPARTGSKASKARSSLMQDKRSTRSERACARIRTSS